MAATGALSKSVLIYGSCGALGRSLTKLFKRNDWKVIGCDRMADKEAHTCIVAPTEGGFPSQGLHIISALQTELNNAGALKAILCASGGFTFGNIADQAVLGGADEMISSSVHPSILCAHLAARFLQPPGLLVLPGAAAALQATPQLVGYGAAKNYVHFLVKSLAAGGSGMPAGVRVIGIAPEMLDTPANRKAMSEADTSNWTNLDDLSNKLLQLANSPQDVDNGKILKISTKNSVTSYSEISI